MGSLLPKSAYGIWGLPCAMRRLLLFRNLRKRLGVKTVRIQPLVIREPCSGGHTLAIVDVFPVRPISYQDGHRQGIVLRAVYVSSHYAWLTLERNRYVFFENVVNILVVDLVKVLQLAGVHLVWWLPQDRRVTVLPTSNGHRALIVSECACRHLGSPRVSLEGPVATEVHAVGYRSLRRSWSKFRSARVSPCLVSRWLPVRRLKVAGTHRPWEHYMQRLFDQSILVA